MEKQSEELSLEDLKRRQEEMASGQKNEQARPTKKANRELTSAEKTKSDQEKQDKSKITQKKYQKRLATIKEANQTQTEIDQFEERRIQERIAKAQQLKESAPAKQAAVEELGRELKSVEERLTALQQLTKGVLPEMISPELRDALASARKKIEEKEVAITQIRNELEQAETVTDEEITRYQQLIEDLDNLNQRIDEISSDPELVKIIYEEAKNESEMRDRLINQALYVSTAQQIQRNPERDNFLKILCEKFISEELEAQGVNSIEEPAKRASKIKQVMEGLMFGLNLHAQEAEINIKNRLTNDNRESVLAGRALRNFIGALGTVDGCITWLSDISGGIERHQLPGFNYAEYPIDLNCGVERHLGSLNMMRAYMNGLKTHRTQVLGYNTSMSGIDNRQNFNQQLSFRAELNGPILLRNAKPIQITQIKQDYEMHFKQAQALEIQLTERAEAEKQQKNTELSRKLAEISEQLKKIRIAERLITEQQATYKNVRDLERELEQQREAVKQVQVSIARNQKISEQPLPPRISWRQRVESKKLQTEALRFLERDQYKLGQLKQAIDLAEQILAAKKLIAENNPTDAEMKKYQLEQQIRHLEKYGTMY